MLPTHEIINRGKNQTSLFNLKKQNLCMSAFTLHLVLFVMKDKCLTDVEIKYF